MQAAIFPEEKDRCVDYGMHPRRSREACGLDATPVKSSGLAEALVNAFDRGACVLVPVFALGKTQEVLAMLYKFRRQSRLLSGEFPIYIGGLSSKMTDIYDRRAHMTRAAIAAPPTHEEVAPFVLNDETMRDAPLRAGRVYALSSGMMIPKRSQMFLPVDSSKTRGTRSFLSATRASNHLPVFCGRRARAVRSPLILTNRPNASAATLNSSSSVHTRRAKR